MGKIIISINPEDVVTLREVFALALMQSEVALNDGDFGRTYEDLSDAYEMHNAVCSLMGRIDAMLPDSTGFFG